MVRLTALGAWIGRNADGLVALAVAAVVAILEVSIHVDQSVFNAAFLFVLGVLVFAMLRDRARNVETEQRMIEYLKRSDEVLPVLADRAKRLETMDATIASVERSLEESSMVRVLSWSEVTAAGQEARRVTDRWLFRGGTGTYIRAVTLPECVASARRDRRPLLVRLEIIDPTNEELCTGYARFRRSLAGGKTNWTLDRTRWESYATIVAACWYHQRYELLDIRVALSQVMPTLRWDLAASHLLITQEDPHGAALMVRQGRLLYEYMNTELRKSFEQARPVPIERAAHLSLGDEPTVDEVRSLLRALGLPLPVTFSDQDVVEIINRALRAENPYDR